MLAATSEEPLMEFSQHVDRYKNEVNYEGVFPFFFFFQIYHPGFQNSYCPISPCSFDHSICI